jgi:outer membrane protein OmpA-like peptidoglycan-associated protein
VKRTLLLAALLAAPLAQAQWNPGPALVDDEVAELQLELDRLRADDDVLEFAAGELARAEDFIEDLAEEPPQAIAPEDIERAERMLARVERIASRRGVRGGERDLEREVVIVQDDDGEDEAAWEEAEQARNAAARSQADAEEERERALAARLEAEHERAENERLRAELGNAQTRITERGLVLTLGDVLFSVGKADLKPGAARTLDKLVAAMRRDRDTSVTIEGHTDSTGKRAYNLALSQRRAAAVRNYLAGKGIASQRILTRGLGPDYPVATNATEAGRQQNRRVEVLVQNDDDE